MLKTAITIWGNRVSPVFDAAGTLLVAHIDDQRVKEKQYISFDPATVSDLILILKKMNINVLVCGAISTEPANMIVNSHIKLISFVTGNVHQLLDTFAKNHSIEKNFMMPGCSRQYSHQSGMERVQP